VNKPCQYRQLGTDMVYSLGRYLYWWSISPKLSVLTWFIHLVVISTGGLLVPSCLSCHGLFTWSSPLLVVYYSPVFCTDMLYSLGCYLYWWSISPQLSVLTWFIHLFVTSTGGLLVASCLYWHGLFTSDQVNKPYQDRQLGTNIPPVEVTTKLINHVSTDNWGLIDHQ
jgi:hypothetical protein